MNKTLSTGEVIAVGLMLFSIFFGAGNLIFPPALGQAAGENLLPAIAGFLVTGVGLPLMGVLAIGLAGGEYTKKIVMRVHPKFALVLLVILNLTIGPLFAIPRTGAVAFEVGIRSLVDADDFALGQFIYTLLFFSVTYFLARNPSKIVDRIGKILTPLLLFFMALLFIQTIYAPLGQLQPPASNYQVAPFLQGFQEGYLTMDLLAFIAIGTIVIHSIQDKGVTSRASIGKLCIIAGLISASLMSVVYISLAYLGASSAEILGQSENGGVILTKVAKLYFGQFGSLILAVIITFACLTTSSGLASSCAYYFNRLSKGKVQYQRILLLIIVFSMIAANVGLNGLISFSVPFLEVIYPVVIVLVLLSLLHPLFQGRHEVYRYSLALTFICSLFGGLRAAGIEFVMVNQFFSQYIPLYGVNLGWLVPAVAGAVFGYVISRLRCVEIAEN